MGIYSRDYVRDAPDGGDGYSPRAAGTDMTKRLVILTGIVFVGQMLTVQPGIVNSDTVGRLLQLDPVAAVDGFQVWRLLTYALCHDTDNLLHIIFNMFIVWMLGRQFESMLGSREFLLFYCASAIFAGLTYTAVRYLAGDFARCVGASGCVCALLMLFALNFPRQRLYLYGLIGIEARWLVGGLVVVDLVLALASFSGAGPAMRVAHSAHLGGFLFGYLYQTSGIRLESLGLRAARAAGGSGMGFRRNRKLRIYRPERPPEDLNVQVDRILTKISEHGESSLTDQEREILNTASRQYRNR